MMQITLTSEDFAKKMVESYNLMKEGFKTAEEHWIFCNAIRWVTGKDMGEEITRMAEDTINNAKTKES